MDHIAAGTARAVHDFFTNRCTVPFFKNQSPKNQSPLLAGRARNRVAVGVGDYVVSTSLTHSRQAYGTATTRELAT